MEEKHTQYLSRSALAEKLGVSLKELTQQLISVGWLLHQPTHTSSSQGDEKSSAWKLTEKGKFEGGVYRESKKFGQYIVWPKTVLSHPALTEVAAALISATQIARHVNLSAKTINLLFANIGWLQAFTKGWEVTTIGKQQGGVQQNNDETGVPYVMWSRELLTHPFLQKKIAHFKGEASATPVTALEGKTYYTTLNGLLVKSLDELLIVHALYIYNMSMVYQQPIMIENGEMVEPTCYLPSYRVYVFFHSSHVSPQILAQQLEQQATITAQDIRSIFISSDDLSNLDHVLSKAFISLGLTI